MHDTLGSMLFLTTAEMLVCITRKTELPFIVHLAQESVKQWHRLCVCKSHTPTTLGDAL